MHGAGRFLVLARDGEAEPNLVAERDGILAVVLFALSLIGIRNSIIRSRNSCQQAWSDIDVQLKRRHDLVPNLVEAVKGYASHETSVFQRVTEARAEAMAASSLSVVSNANRLRRWHPATIQA